MKKLFMPKKYIKHFLDLNLNELKSRGIKLIICDVDNTLVAHDVAHPDDEVKTFVGRVHAAGLEICLISNNHKERVEKFARGIDVKFYSFAKKPLKQTYKKIIADYKIQPNQIASIGDQLMTDVFGGNRMRIYTVLMHPLINKDLKATKINRKIENLVFRRLEKKKLIQRGVFDE